MRLPFIRGGSPTPLAGRRPSTKQLGKSPDVARIASEHRAGHLLVTAEDDDLVEVEVLLFIKAELMC